jgi:hypothetical protein
LTVLGFDCPLSHDIVQQAPENTRFGLSLIAGIKRISMAIYESQGYRCLRISWHHYMRAKTPVLSLYGSPEL